MDTPSSQHWWILLLPHRAEDKVVSHVSPMLQPGLVLEGKEIPKAWAARTPFLLWASMRLSVCYDSCSFCSWRIWHPGSSLRPISVSAAAPAKSSPKSSGAIVGKLGLHLLCEGTQGCVCLIFALRTHWAPPMCQPPDESWGTTAISTQEVSAPKGKVTWEERRGPWLILRSHMRLLEEGDIEIELWKVSRSFCPPFSHCCYPTFLYSSFIEWSR